MTWEIRAVGSVRNIAERLRTAAGRHLEGSQLPKEHGDQANAAIDAAEAVVKSKAFGSDQSAFLVHLSGNANASHVTASPDEEGPSEHVAIGVRLATKAELEEADADAGIHSARPLLRAADGTVEQEPEPESEPLVPTSHGSYEKDPGAALPYIHGTQEENDPRPESEIITGMPSSDEPGPESSVDEAGAKEGGVANDGKSEPEDAPTVI